MNRCASRKLLVINQYYDPDLASTGQLAAEICSSLALLGFEVHVVTAQPSYTSSALEAPQFEVLDGVFVHRISLGGTRGRERMMVRLEGYIRFLWGAWRLARSLVKSERPHQVMTFHNPPFVSMLGAYLAGKYGLRYLYVLYDIHPDILLATNWARLPPPLVWAWEAVNRWVLRRAHSVVVLGEGMKKTLIDGKGVSPDRVHVIPMWARPELQPAPKAQSIRQELGIGEEDILLLYAGNMGIMHPIEPILDAAASLQGLPVHFLFVGDGAKRQGLISRIENERLKQVTFLPFQPEDRFIKILATSDASFVVLQPGLERLAVPSRAYTFLSAAKPLITLMAPDADIARLVAEVGCGWNVTNGEELSSLLRTIIHSRHELVCRGRKGRAAYEENFQREFVINQYVKLLQD